MVSRLVRELITRTAWGDLDYLVIDFPPGTGDIQITICQQVKIDGAIIVTTPQLLSVIDVVKGLRMFDEFMVSTVAIVENMSYFICTNCQTQHYPFGPGYLKELMETTGSRGFKIPLLPQLSTASDGGNPFVLAPSGFGIDQKGEKVVQDVYQQLATSTVEELQKLKEVRAQPPTFQYDESKNQIIIKGYHDESKKCDGHHTISPIELRSLCQCASCLSYEGKRKDLNLSPQQQKIFKPLSLEGRGNYAVAVLWSDNHRSIYPYHSLWKFLRVKPTL